MMRSSVRPEGGQAQGSRLKAQDGALQSPVSFCSLKSHVLSAPSSPAVTSVRLEAPTVRPETAPLWAGSAAAAELPPLAMPPLQSLSGGGRE